MKMHVPAPTNLTSGTIFLVIAVVAWPLLSSMASGFFWFAGDVTGGGVFYSWAQFFYPFPSYSNMTALDWRAATGGGFLLFFAWAVISVIGNYSFRLYYHLTEDD